MASRKQRAAGTRMTLRPHPEVLLCRMGWHRWIVLPLREPDFWLERLCLRCERCERLVADRWGLSVDWRETKSEPP